MGHISTKFILHGGFDKARGIVQEDDEFFREILKDAPDEAKVLVMYFAEQDDLVPMRIEQDQAQFAKNSGSKKFHFKAASEQTLEENCAWADIIYLHGGRTAKLMDVLKKYPNIKQMLLNKTIAADSAGVKVLGQFYDSHGVIGEGLGILPLKIVAHYHDGAPNPLADVEPELETLFLREYETKVLHL